MIWLSIVLAKRRIPTPRPASNEKEIGHGPGAVANTLKLYRNAAVGFVDWLGRRERTDCDVVSVWISK
jgi:hypothetical protein